MSRRGPAHFYDNANHKPQVAKNGTYLETMHLRKITKTPVFTIFKGSSAVFVGVYRLFSNYSLFKTAKNVEQIQCCSAQLTQT